MFLTAVQNCTTAKDAWEKREAIYAGKIFFSKIGMLDSSLKMKLEENEQLGNHIAKMETKASRLASMNDSVGESMQMAIVDSSLFRLQEYSPIVVSFNIMKHETSFNYVTKGFIQKQERKKLG